MGTRWLEGEHVRKEPRERSEMLALMGFPSNVQLVGGQYFYAINLGDGWQIAAQPTWSYVRDINLLRFPLGVGVSKVGAVGKKDFPLKLAAQLWGYTPPPDGSGPEWQSRITVSPIFNRPW